MCSSSPAALSPRKTSSSTKTVELHLSSAYRKLGIRSRRELPAALVPR
jgi:DNA-binding NarL/FixJ family response regulator